MIKYDRNGFKPRPRQLVLTQTAAYVIEEAKIKQRVLYTSLKGEDNEIIYVSPLGKYTCQIYVSLFDCFSGISVSNLTDAIIVLHITCEDPKQKVCMQEIFIRMFLFFTPTGKALLWYEWK